MEFTRVAEQRTSVREFTEEQVPVSDIREMIRIAGCAPCVGGKETWRFIAVTRKSLMHKMADAVKKKYDELMPASDGRINDIVKNTVGTFSTVFTKAPVVIAVLSEPYTAVIDKILTETSFTHGDINKLRNYPDIQTIGACIENLILAAVNLGYGACWQTGSMVAKDELSEMLNVKKPFELTAFVAVGKPRETPLPRKKKPVEETLTLIE